MGKVAIVADVHVGNHQRFGGEVIAGINQRAKFAVGALRRAVRQAEAQDCDRLVIAGDLFDSAAPTPQLVAAVAGALGDELEVFILRGNHDMVSAQQGDHALGPLGRLSGVEVIEAPTYLPAGDGSVDLVLVPFRPGDARVWFPVDVRAAMEGNGTRECERRVLVTHLGIIDADTPAFLRNAHDAIPLDVLEELCPELGIDEVWAGNWHEHKVWTCTWGRVGQVGALAPTGFDNEGLCYGTMPVLDSAAGQVITLPGPRFLDVRSYEELGLPAHLKSRGCSELFVRFFAEPGELAARRKQLAAAVEAFAKEGVVLVGNVEEEPDKLVQEAAREVAAEAAEKARSADTLNAAVDAFVTGKLAPDDRELDRAEVGARARRYLAAVPGAIEGNQGTGAVESLLFKGFATYGSQKVQLPARGVVAVTGVNGAGKSTLIEGVATALWNEPLRGDVLWREGEAGVVGVETSTVEAVRERSKGGKGALTWRPRTARAATAYESTTKAQQALEAFVGSFDLWRRVAVFSSADSAAFTAAPDAERKRLLEAFLGLDRFDAALKAAKADEKVAFDGLTRAERDLAIAQGAVQSYANNLASAQAAVDGFVAESGGKSVDELRAEVARLDGQAKKAKATLDGFERDRAALREKMAAARATVDAGTAKAARIEALDRCPTCAQAVGKEHKEAVSLASARAAMQSKALLDELQAELTAVDGDLADVRETYGVLTNKSALAAQALTRAEANAGARARAEDALKRAHELHAKAGRDAEAKGLLVAEAKKQRDLAAHVCTVLGTRGVRALVLDAALSGLERAVNRWLRRFPTEDGTLRVQVAGSAQLKNGATSEVITISVAKASDPERWRGYRSCSQGERRRLDLGFLFGLRELAAAAHGEVGTLWCDEVFDALDAQGAQDVSSALAELAKERCVVVVTHSPTLLAHLRPALHLHVALDGEKRANVQTVNARA